MTTYPGDPTTQKIVGLSMKGGRKDQFFFCLLGFWPEENRWFLQSLLQVKDEEGIGGDDAIRAWIQQYHVEKLVLDFPLSQPSCASCLLECPGVSHCPDPVVTEVQKRMLKILGNDQKLRKENPKRYEQDRNGDDIFDFNKDILDKPADSYILSRAFKRRLKKGYLPYWNRSIDFWVWCHYYNQLLDLFNISFDSFGNTSLMVQTRLSYLRRHFPKELNLYESHVPIVLIELLRSKIILKRDVSNLTDMDLAIEARLDIIKRIEKALNIFIYDHDLDVLCRNPRAFESFLLAIAGQNNQLSLNISLPDWTLPDQTGFVIPQF